MSLLPRLLAGLLLLAITGLASADEALYSATVRTDAADTLSAPSRIETLNVVQLTQDGRGARVQTRTLWTRRRDGGDSSLSTLDLDPQDPTQARMLAVLSAGVTYRLDPALQVRGIEMDEAGLAQVASAQPALSDLAPLPRWPLDPLPWPLPASPRVGQSVQRTLKTALYGAVTWEEQVVAVSKDALLLQIAAQAKGVDLQGRVALRRSDGMPVELKLRGNLSPAGVPGRPMQMHLVRLEPGTWIDPIWAEGDQAGSEQLFADMLARPPFSAPSDNPDDYTHATPDGTLAPWMLDEASLAQIERQWLFAAVPRPPAARPLLAIGGQVGSDASPRSVVARVRAVSLQDAQQRPIRDLQPQVLPPQLVLVDHYRASEDAANFPFRLPPGVTAQALEALAQIRMDVDVEVYAWDGAEVVPRGGQSTINPAARLRWDGPLRMIAQQAPEQTGTDSGLWTLAVPLDSHGEALPAATLTLPATPDDALADPTLRLDWERRQAPSEVALASPTAMAAVRLQHYRWRRVPRAWIFRDARRMAPPAGSDGN